jgi:hypothetical protein
LITIGVGMAMSGAVKGWLYNSTITQTQLMEQKYRSKFNQLSETHIDSSTSTSKMQNVVKSVDRIKERYLVDPEEMFVLISNDVSIFPDIRIKSIDWFVSDFSDSEAATEVTWGDPQKKRARKKSRDKKPKVEPKKGFFEIAMVEGEFLNFDGDYRYALSAVDDLGKAMSDSGNYYSVEITKRPLDIESDNQLRGDVSVGRGTRLLRAEVGFRLVREVITE